jgi:hypothetical protein
MAKQYQRKTKSLVEQTTEVLENILKTRGGADGRPIQFRRPTPEELARSFERLAAWVDVIRRDPCAYSALVQVWLDYWGLCWPKGVFQRDLGTQGRGRPQESDLGWRARQLYRPNDFGWMKVAKKLIPPEYQRNATAAANKVRHAAQNYREHVSRLELGVRNVGLKMLGLPLSEESQDE